MLKSNSNDKTGTDKDDKHPERSINLEDILNDYENRRAVKFKAHVMSQKMILQLVPENEKRSFKFGIQTEHLRKNKNDWQIGRQNQVKDLYNKRQTGQPDRQANLTDRPTWQTGQPDRQANLADRPNDRQANFTDRPTWQTG